MQEQNPPFFPDSAPPDFPPPIPFETLQSTGSGRAYRFKFYGDTNEYFGIWIVNILLTIITLSFYAPWAKVRRLRYFYGNSEFIDRKFDFTGVPKKILIGRLIALGIYAGISIGAQYSINVSIFGFLILYLAIPWLIRATLRFTARNSKYGNSRFYFGGTTKDSYIALITGVLIYIFTLGLFTPVLIWLYKRYCINNLYAGQLKFQLHADWPAYMRAVYIPIFMFLGIILVLVILGFMLASRPDQALVFFGIGYAFVLFFIWPLISARIFITTWNNTTVGNSQFQTDCNQWRYAWIVGSNWIVKVLSIGLMSAWAAIRLYRYQIESLSLTLFDDPNEMMNQAQEDHSAIAEEISDIFDIDVSL